MDAFTRIAWSIVLFGLTLPHNTRAHTGDARFEIEAYHASEPARTGTTYRLVPTNLPGAPDMLIPAEQDLRRALAAHGWTEATGGSRSDVDVSVSFAITERVEPQSRYSRRFRPVTHRIRTLDVSVPDENGKTTRVRQEVVVPVDDGYVASSSRRSLVTQFEKRLIVSAREATGPRSSSQPTRELWRVVVTNKDMGADTEAYARLMVLAAANALTRPTSGPRQVASATVTAGRHNTSRAR